MRLGMLLLLLVLAMASSSAEAAIRYRVTLVDPSGEFADERRLILANLDAALADWGRFIEGRGVLHIELRVTRETSTGRFSGSSTRFVPRGRGTVEGSGTRNLRTGRAARPGKPDIRIEIQPDFMRAHYWTDPHPDRRTDPVPAGKIDLVTVLAHELGHAFGFEGLRNVRTTRPYGRVLSTFDRLMDLDQEPTFVGRATRAAYGGPLPLSFFPTDESVQIRRSGRLYRLMKSVSQNLYHYGRFSPEGVEEPETSFRGLMAGAWARPADGAGLRILVGPLDAAVLADLGVPLVSQEGSREGSQVPEDSDGMR